MHRDPGKYLADILQCIAELELFTNGKTLDDYQRDVLLRRASEREFIIIAEALFRLGKNSSETQARVDHVRKIANFRNILVHEYDVVDNIYVWNVIARSVPILKQQIEMWSSELGR